MNIYLPIAQMSVDVFGMLFLGGMTGILAGVFGVGGGFLMTPLLIFIGVPPAIAVASVANQIIASSASGFHTHWRKGNVDFRMGSLMLVGGLIGSSVGVWIFSLLKGLGQIDLVISIAYVLLLTLIGGTMAIESSTAILRNRRTKREEEALAALEHYIMGDDTPRIRDIPLNTDIEVNTLAAAPTKKRRKARFDWLPFHIQFPRSNLEMSLLLPLGLSALIGVLVSILGIGGGFFMIPAMLYILKMPASVVVGTSLFQVIFVTSNVTFLHAVTTQSVDLVLAVLMLVGSSIGAQLGTRIGMKLPEEYMRGLLALIVLAVAVRLAYNLVAVPESLYSISIISGGG